MASHFFVVSILVYRLFDLFCIYVGHLTLDVVEIDTHEQTGRVSLEIRSTKGVERLI